MTKGRWIVIIAMMIGSAGWAAACSSDTDNTLLPGGSGGNGQAAGGPGGGTAGFGQGGDTFDAGGGCKSDDDCNGGTCMQNGECCESADQVCGSTCCDASEVCLYDQCLEPGDLCLSPADCPEGWYCEPALGGDIDAGVVDAGPDANCTQPLPPTGRCLPLPPICGEGDAGAGGGCIEPCEYHPPPGQLAAKMKWWWGYDPPVVEFPDSLDIWATPTVARVYDANCDGKVDITDPPNVLFVSADVLATCCQCTGLSPSRCKTGVLRMLDGTTGEEIWSLDKAKSGNLGFAGLSIAIGDIDGDQWLDVIALTGDGYMAMINAYGQVERVSDLPVDGASPNGFGWGGGISLGDMDGDGYPEIAYGRTLFETTGGAITRLWAGSEGWGGGTTTALSHFVDLDGNGTLELLAGRTAYRKDGSTLWSHSSPEGFTAIGDFDNSGTPDVVVVSGGWVYLLNGADGTTLLDAVQLPGNGGGGPPTVADFDGDGYPEIGVAQKNLYTMVKPDFGNDVIDIVWSQTNHDMSSSVTGSSVFDFEGDGKAEVIYNDECYLWVYDGTDGTILFTDYTQSFTATEASIVADIDGDGHAEMLLPSNGASTSTWTCAHHDAPGKIVSPHTEAFPVWEPSPHGSYRGLRAFGDAANSWVGTRTLWNQHAYQVTNICDPRDSACGPGAYYGQIPPDQKNNWLVPWLNNFRQNVQDEGLFDAPDAVVWVEAECVTPVPITVSIRNMGLAALPGAVDVGLFKQGSPNVQLAKFTTGGPLLPGQTQVFEHVASNASVNDAFFARVLIDPLNPTFHECREDNNESPAVVPNCAR